MALFMHSFSWSFMIMLPTVLYNGLENVNFIFALVFIGNISIHFFTDNLKANKHKINLITDQLIHMSQIILTFIILIN